jgi:hypothetical protein
MKFERVAIGWTPGGDVDVVSACEIGRSERLEKHPMKTSPVYRSDLMGIDGESAKLAVLVHFHMLVVRDNIDPAKVHKAFMDIEEYRDAIAADTLPADVPRWVTPSRRRERPTRRHGQPPKRTTSELLAYYMAREKAASALLEVSWPIAQEKAATALARVSGPHGAQP